MSIDLSPKIKLDWSRLLGFDQASTSVVDAVAAARLNDPRLAKLGVKPGPKPCPEGSMLGRR